MESVRRLVLHVPSVSIKIQDLSLHASLVVLDRIRTRLVWPFVSIVLLGHTRQDSETVIVRLVLRVALRQWPNLLHVESVMLDCLLLQLACHSVLSALRVDGRRKVQ